jgi:hypothetical protein
MGKDKVVIAVVTIIVFSAVLFGIVMAYRIYTLPMAVDNIDDTINILKNDYSEDEETRMIILSMFNDLSRSCKMKDKTTGEVRKFTKEEMEEIYNSIGGKESVIKYLNSIDDEKEKREKLEFACYRLKIITSDELIEIWNQR